MGSWLPANELRNMLICDEDSEFNEWHVGNPISAKSIKKYLRDAGVEHRRDKQGSHYSLKDLNELVKRYVVLYPYKPATAATSYIYLHHGCRW